MPLGTSAYVAPIIEKPIPLIIKKRTKPQFDFGQLHSNEIQQLETIPHNLKKPNKNDIQSNLKLLKIRDDDFNVENNLINQNQYIFPNNKWQQQTNNKQNIVSKFKQQETDMISNNLSDDLETINQNNNNNTSNYLMTKDIYKQKGLYFVKKLNKNSQNLEEIVNTPSGFVQLSPLLKSNSGNFNQNNKLFSQQKNLLLSKNILNSLNQNALNELMAIKNIPNLNELINGMDLSILNQPGGYEKLKQQFIQRYMMRSLNLSPNTPSN